MELKENDDEKGSLWADGFFAESMGSAEMKEKIKTMHKGHDEDINYNCKKCDKKISAHNKDWHNGMCDMCFNKEYYSNDAERSDASETDDGIEAEEKELKEKLENFNPKEYSVLELCKESGTGINAINDANTETFMPLLMAIEETIWRHYSENDSLKDSNIIESLKSIRGNIFSNDIQFNKMEKDMINKVKIVLFLNNYDKRDLSLSISRVLKSAKLHKSSGGSRGYLNFISVFFNQLG